MPPVLILVCHAADRHFADGDRAAVRRLFEQSDVIDALELIGPDQYRILCPDGGGFVLRAPGLDGDRSFHRMEVALYADYWTSDMLMLLFNIMHSGGFGLVEDLEAPQFIVTRPQQVSYFPWLPQPPLLVRSPRDLGYTIWHVAG